ncbi:hypothetical protein QBC41DRAFT_237224 [Cercophora samala]|uniref:Uncharacterized protein n=1 Tax=Cercophora samala TaxID=330535 RepID=A0AA39YXR6_9PEZI|nr:hypothetical protein QBC41DRAFT_237224 [Cercophora samala]
MFDASFTQLKLYFQLLHLLRIAQEFIQEASTNLRSLSAQHRIMMEKTNADKSNTATRDAVVIVSKNWDTIIANFDAQAATLAGLISTKTGEIERLRDGIMNATTLLEASKSTSMNRHIIIFTAVTIFYLPLGFVTAVYSMSLIGDEALSHLKGPYVGSMLAVAGLTYMVSIAVVFFVDRKKITPWLLQQVPAGIKAKPWFWTACDKLNIKQPGLHPPRGPPIIPRPPGVKVGDKSVSKGWRALWLKGGLDLRRRKKGGNSAPAATV